MVLSTQIRNIFSNFYSPLMADSNLHRCGVFQPRYKCVSITEDNDFRVKLCCNATEDYDFHLPATGPTEAAQNLITGGDLKLRWQSNPFLVLKAIDRNPGVYGVGDFQVWRSLFRRTPFEVPPYVFDILDEGLLAGEYHYEIKLIVKRLELPNVITPRRFISKFKIDAENGAALTTYYASGMDHEPWSGRNDIEYLHHETVFITGDFQILTNSGKLDWSFQQGGNAPTNDGYGDYSIDSRSIQIWKVPLVYYFD